jgi:hypothetical protein
MVDHDPVADFDLGHTLPQFGYFATWLMTGPYVRVRNSVRRFTVFVKIAPAHAGRSHLDQDITRPWPFVREFLNFSYSIAKKYYALHVMLLACHRSLGHEATGAGSIPTRNDLR